MKVLALVAFILCLFIHATAQEKPQTKITLNTGEVIYASEVWDSSISVWFVKDGKTVLYRRDEVKSIERPVVKVEVKNEYDRFKDTTTVSVGPLAVSKEPFSKLVFSAALVYPGRVPIGAKGIAFVFAYGANQGRLSDGKPHLYVLADGERYELGAALSTGREFQAGGSTEGFLLAVPLETAEKIFNAKSVEMQFGGVEFVIAENVRDAMREMIRFLKPARR